jgi:hypothetical protein
MATRAGNSSNRTKSMTIVWWRPAAVVAATSLVLAACAGQQNTNQQSYAESVASRPMPATEEDRMSECNWIRSEIARQQNIGQASAAVASSSHGSRLSVCYPR